MLTVSRELYLQVKRIVGNDRVGAWFCEENPALCGLSPAQILELGGESGLRTLVARRILED